MTIEDAHNKADDDVAEGEGEDAVEVFDPLPTLAEPGDGGDQGRSSGRHRGRHVMLRDHTHEVTSTYDVAPVRGSRAETVTYLEEPVASGRRTIVFTVLALAICVGVALGIIAVDHSNSNSYAAVIEPAGSIDLSFLQTGTLSNVLVHQGQQVTKQQLLASEADQTEQSVVTLTTEAVKEDKTLLSYLRTEQKYAPLPDSHLNPVTIAQQINDAEAQLASNESALAVATSRAAASQLRAPANGTIISVAGQPGDLVGPQGVRQYTVSNPAVPSNTSSGFFPKTGGTSSSSGSYLPVVNLQTGKGWSVTADVPENDIPRVHLGEKATFIFANFGSADLACRVASIGNSAVLVDGNVDYEVVLTSLGAPPHGTLPGMSGSVSFD